MAESRPGDVQKVVAVGNQLADMLRKLANPQGRQRYDWAEVCDILSAWEDITDQARTVKVHLMPNDDLRMWRSGEKVL